MDVIFIVSSNGANCQNQLKTITKNEINKNKFHTELNIYLDEVRDFLCFFICKFG
jgi:hypothetical protein